ncbi:MAG: type I DNA topoisomerase [Limnochordia bacterium]|nr:type I DNA topoisomerase [Limnochordia bacterium]
MATLIIVESPAKAQTIKGFLGKNYNVKASLGHVRDLPRSKFGIDVESNFEPHYITIRGKGPVLKELREAAKKADRILLATDPDREGEAIAWHLAAALKVDEEKCRIDFREITKDAIKQAVKKPRSIGQPLVDAQQARRVVDRIVGYQLSPLLWAKVKPGLSAGRVQSVAVKLIVDREREIEAFVEEEYWSVNATLQTKLDELFEAKLHNKAGKKLSLPNEEAAKEVERDATGQKWTVAAVTKKERRRNPAPPFTTSTLQQEAARKLGYAAKKTMRLAQQLYEGLPMGKLGTLGLITYMRTDATRVSNEAVVEVREFIETTHGAAYVPAKPRQYASKKGAQEAHEAVRPTSTLRTPADVKQYLSRDQFRLYTLIWERFVASQMASAVFDAMTVDLKVQDYLFRATGSQLKFPGFLKIYQEGTDAGSQSNDNKDRLLPDLKVGEDVLLQKLDLNQHFTQPPARFTEAMLVKTLEEEGIGRPSTYAPIIDTITGRGYVSREEKRFRPTELGIVVTDLLAESFPRLLDVKFTAGLEEELDGIEEGNMIWQDVIAEFYQPFAEDLEKAHEELERIEIQDEVSDVLCEKCGSNMVYKLGRYGKFLACPGYPDCKNTKPILHEIGIECSLCQKEGREAGQLVRRRSRRGRYFYGCSNYPDCTYTSWQLPVAELCPHCGKNLTIRKEGADPQCSNKECPGGDEK